MTNTMRILSSAFAELCLKAGMKGMQMDRPKKP